MVTRTCKLKIVTTVEPPIKDTPFIKGTIKNLDMYVRIYINVSYDMFLPQMTTFLYFQYTCIFNI